MDNHRMASGSIVGLLLLFLSTTTQAEWVKCDAIKESRQCGCVDSAGATHTVTFLPGTIDCVSSCLVVRDPKAKVLGFMHYDNNKSAKCVPKVSKMQIK